jgi:adenylate kinase
VKVVLLGPPGAGKGTQSKYLEDHFRLKQLSTGDMLRSAVAAGSQIGSVAKSYMEGGKLVPDEVVVGIISQAIDALPKDLAGFVLDGFPRTVQQAQALDGLLDRMAKRIDAVIVVDVSDDALVERISGRFTCAGCGELYNDYFRAPKVEGTCDRCGSTSFNRRSDDNAVTVRERLLVYHSETKPLIDYYRTKGRLHIINGDLPIADVQRGIDEIMRSRHGHAPEDSRRGLGGPSRRSPSHRWLGWLIGDRATQRPPRANS